jgi:hypothetical protein
MTEPTPEKPQEAYVRQVEDANRRWKTKAEALNVEFAQLLASSVRDQSPAALHSQYMRRRETERAAWQGRLSDAAATYRERTGETNLPAVGWTPGAPEPLPAPGLPAVRPQEARGKSRWLPLVGVIVALFAIGVVASAVNASRPGGTGGSSDTGTTSYSSTVEVLYEVEGSATGANLTMESATGTVQANGKAVPLVNKTSGKRGLTFTMPRGHFVYLSAQNEGSRGSITCRITVDGIVVSTNTSSGAYTIASCKGTA